MAPDIHVVTVERVAIYRGNWFYVVLPILSLGGSIRDGS